MIFSEINSALAAKLLPVRTEHNDKTDFGRLLCICGCANMPGAAVLSCGGALRSGVGLCTLASVPPVCSSVLCHYPGCVLNALPSDPDGYISGQSAAAMVSRLLPNASAVLFGCGVGISDSGSELLCALIGSCTVPLVIDADGLNLLCKDISMLEKTCCPIILTPHERETKRLLKASGLSSAQALAEKYGLTVIKKGAVTEIYSDGKGYRLDMPNSALAKGGSGDILAGLVAGFAAQGADCCAGAVCGVYIHASAGQAAREIHGSRAALVTDILDNIDTAFMQLEEC